ncbi:MAG TPA: hypothetical protein VG146_19190 [Verrucomicrobiae bacterium]|nr:hypothetical protein [Verrucomicrobiae bacterium]
MSASSTRLAALTKELWVHWQQTKQYWNDAQSQEFERRYLVELMSTVDKSVTVVEQLDKLVGKIRKDCE